MLTSISTRECNPAAILEVCSTGSQDACTRKVEIKAVSIDEHLKDENITFIKLDIEGAEIETLQGAEETIRRCNPKLEISAYH